MKSLIAAIVVLASLAVGARGQTPGPNAAVKTTTVPLDRLNEQQARNVKTEWVTYKGRKALRVIDTAPPDVADGIQLVILNKTEFRDGTIEIELTGEPSPTAKSTAPRGFVGVAFRVNLDAAKDVAKYECFYLRPTNGRADDQVRRNYSTQYISHPDFPWFQLRKEFPEKYESYADVVPGEWTRLKIEVHGDKARLYVQGAPPRETSKRRGNARPALCREIATSAAPLLPKLQHEMPARNRQHAKMAALGYTVSMRNGLGNARSLLCRIPLPPATRIPRGYAINGAAVKHGVQHAGVSDPRGGSRREIRGKTAEIGELQGRNVLATESNASPASPAATQEDASRFCPVCSQRLESRRCKLVCNVCGYYMSCADYY